MDDNKYVKKIYMMMLNDIQIKPNKICWAKSLKCLLENLGFYHVWLMQSVGNEKVFISLFKQRLKDTFLQDLNVTIENERPLINYFQILVLKNT